MDARNRIQFRTLFPDSWQQLQRQDAVLNNLSGRHGTAPQRRTRGWRRNRLVSVLGRLFSRTSRPHPTGLGLQLFNRYLQALEQRHEPRTQPLQRRRIGARQQSLNASSRPVITSRQQLQLALAMQLAGLARINNHKGQLTLKLAATSLSAKQIQRLDHSLNCTPVRLAYEYLAANRIKQLPGQFLSQLLIPDLSEQLQAATGLSPEESTNLVKELLQRHNIGKPGDLGLENLMEIKNTIRRLGNEHRRLVSAITTSNKMQGSSASEPETKALQQRTASATSGSCQSLLQEHGASLSSVRHYFQQALVENDFKAARAEQVCNRILNSRGITGNDDITLTRLVLVADDIARLCAKKRSEDSREHCSETLVLKYINQLRPQTQLALPRRRIAPASTAEASAQQQKSPPRGTSVPKPSLTPASANPDIVCDSDDEWMIQQQVENGHLLRLAGDFAKRVARWCGRNKRVIGTEAGLLVLLGAIYGVQTGGISVALMLVTYVLSGVTWLAIDTVSDRLHRLHISRKLRRADAARQQGGNPDNHVEDYLDSYSWLTRHGGLTDILNGFRNLQQNVEALNRKPDDPHMSAKERIRRRKAQALCQMRSQQLGQAFQSLDQLVVESVQEVSRLDQHFMDSFPTLWQPFEQLDERTRVKVFNQAANSRELRKSWFLPPKDYTGWVRNTLNYKNSEVDQVALTTGQFLDLSKPLSEQELKQQALASHLDRSARVGRKLLKSTASTAKDYLTFTLRSTIWRYFESALGKAVLNINPSAAGLAPIPTATGAVIWLYCFTAGKITNTLNRLHNRAQVKRYIASHRQDRFDEGMHRSGKQKKAAKARKDFDNSFLGLRREAKENTKTVVKTLKTLRREKQLIDQELQRQLELGQTLSHADLVHRARLILRHKMLEKQFYQTLNGAFGHMHNETVKAASWLQGDAGISG